MPGYRMRDAGRETMRGSVVAIMVGVAVIIVVLIIGVVGVFGFGWFQQGTADFRGETQKKNQVEGSGAYRIAAYDHFFDLCASVQTDEQSIKNLQKELDDKSTSPERAQQVRASITALRNQRGETIAQYNADARKTATAGKFQSSNLPYQLDVNNEETQCAA